MSTSRPVSDVESDIHIDLWTSGHGADDVWGGGLGGGLCMDAVLGRKNLFAEKQIHRLFRMQIVKRKRGVQRADGLGAAAVLGSG